MIRVTVFYPWTAGTTFDMAYYRDKHMSLVRERLGDACKSVSIDEGVSGGQPGVPPQYTAMCHLGFESTEAFERAFGPNVEEFMADIPNYTDIQPAFQISEVRL